MTSNAQDRLACQIITRDAQRILSNLIVSLQQAGLNDVAYAIRSRVKDPRKLADKVERKIHEEGKTDYSIFSVTDIIGLRIITLFRVDAIRIVSLINEILSHSRIKPNPLKKHSLEEATIYSPHASTDIVAQEIKQYIDSEKHIGCSATINEKPEKYSSIHLVARTEESVDFGADIEFDDKYHIPIEIQIRTAFEDAWGEIDHLYGYTKRRSEGSRDPNTELTDKHLGLLKEFVDGCVKFADFINDQCSSVEGIDKSQGNVSPVSRKDEALENRLTKAGADKGLSRTYLALKARRDALFATRTKSEPSNDDELTSIAKEFLELKDEADKGNEHEIVYYTKMAAALCYLRISSPSSCKRAAHIYKDVSKSVGNNALISLRLGQAWSRAGQSPLAIKHYKDARSLSDTRDANGSVRLLTDDDIKFVRSSVFRLLGFEYWISAKRLNRDQPDFANHLAGHLKLAYKTTLDGIAVAEKEGHETRGLLNNLVFYGIEAVQCSKELSPKNGKHIVDKDKLYEHIEMLRTVLTKKEVEPTLNELDTWMYASYFIGDHDQAVELAKDIIQTLNSTSEERSLFPHENEILNRAKKIEAKKNQ